MSSPSPAAAPTTVAETEIRARAPGCVTARVRVLGGRPAVIVRIDGSIKLGALSALDGETITEAANLALEKRLPLVCTIASSGADILEGVSALSGWGKAARAITRCSGVVPLVFAVTGPAVSGPALLIGLADLVVMTDEAYAFVSGPAMVQQFTGEVLTNERLGGPGMHHRTSGVTSMVVPDEDAAMEAITHLLSFLPSHNDQAPPVTPCLDPVDRPLPDAADVLPASPTGSYDVRDVIAMVVDDADFTEVRAAWAANLVTGFARIGGRPVGVVANQPQTVAGTLDIAASQKGGRFVATCDAFNLPILTLVDTSGFYPGKDLEWRGMIRYGAQLAFAYARATVPRVCVTLRKSYGGAYIVMDSKYMGNDVMLAWPSAEIAVMGAKGAVEILHRRNTPEERAELERAYEDRLLNPYIAAERGSVDAVIDPADTRREVAAAFEMLLDKRERLPHRRHDNGPL
jgi:acetyl-CoA carboxylase carboxyltransferase component